jgi:hypothetical protein
VLLATLGVHMTFQMVALSETLGANCTLMQPLARVCAHVFGQITALRECLAALFATERPLAWMKRKRKK